MMTQRDDGLFYRKHEHAIVLQCRLCPGRTFRWNGGSLTAHGEMHVREGRAERIHWTLDAENRFRLTGK